MDPCCGPGRSEGPCEPKPLMALGMLGGAVLLVLFVRLLHDPHLPPRLYWLSWLAALLVMSRVGCLGGMWLNRRSPVALPEGHNLLDVIAKLKIWVAFGIGLPMAAFTTMGLIARLGNPGRPGPPPPPPPPGPGALWHEVLHHGGGHGADPGPFLGMALVFVPTALVCLVGGLWARKYLKRREMLLKADKNAHRVGLITTGYSLSLLWFLLEPSPDRMRHDLAMMFCPTVLPNHAIATAAAAGVWKVWFAVRHRVCGTSAPPPEEAALETPAGEPVDPSEPPPPPQKRGRRSE